MFRTNIPSFLSALAGSLLMGIHYGWDMGFAAWFLVSAILMRLDKEDE